MGFDNRITRMLGVERAAVRRPVDRLVAATIALVVVLVTMLASTRMGLTRDEAREHAQLRDDANGAAMVATL